MIYLDANASEPLRPEARAAAVAALEVCGNPASIHGAGRAARRLIEDAREALARLLGARPADIVFTSGATEANALAIHGLGAGRPVLMGATEHDAVRAAAPGAVVLPVTAHGVVAPSVLEAALRAHPGALVCLMAANNETGVLHDIEGAAGLCSRHGAILHVDAVQAVGRGAWPGLLPGIGALAISGHKCGGPLGAGALVLAPAQAAALQPLIAGGGQENGRRGGTPALPAIAGMVAALRGAYNAGAISCFRREIEDFAAGMGALVVGAGAPRLPNTICLAYPGLRADTQLIGLDMQGVAVSAGSACSSGKLAASHVLAAMGLAGPAGQAIRISLPWNVTAADVAGFIQAYEIVIKRALRGAKRASTEAAV